jgi:hypothetical protein
MYIYKMKIKMNMKIYDSKKLNRKRTTARKRKWGKVSFLRYETHDVWEEKLSKRNSNESLDITTASDLGIVIYRTRHQLTLFPLRVCLIWYIERERGERRKMDWIETNNCMRSPLHCRDNVNIYVRNLFGDFWNERTRLRSSQVWLHSI